MPAAISHGQTTAQNAGNNAANVASARGNGQVSTSASIDQINQAAEQMNAINLATTMAQLSEQGPKNMKSLTQG